MRTKTKVISATAVALVIAGAAATVSIATGNDDVSLQGDELERATGQPWRTRAKARWSRARRVTMVTPPPTRSMSGSMTAAWSRCNSTNVSRS